VILHDHSSDYSVPFLLNTFLKPNYYIGVSYNLIAWCQIVLGVKENVFLLQNIIIKQQHSKRINPKGMVLVGNIKPSKNQLFAIELAHFLKKDLTIIGKIQDETYFQLLHDKVQDLEIESNIIFVNDENNPQKRLNEFEFGLMTSASESGPLVLIEYLAQSLPFISFKTGAVSDIIADELPNSFVDSFDLLEWKKRLNSIIKYHTNYESLYDTYFSPSNYSQECIAIYKDILKNY
jgi:glycosyltransferase involved in cell wall biosynthesis